MKALLFLALGLLPFSTNALDAGVSHTVYQTADGQPYLEIQMEISPEAALFRAVDSTWLQAKVEVLILIKQGETIAAFDKYVLLSPRSDGPIPLLDVRRFSLKNGEYQIEITFSDLGNAQNAATFRAPVKIEIQPNALFCSDIQLLASCVESENTAFPFVKNGWFLEPLPWRFINKNQSNLLFYQEINHADRLLKDDYLIRYFVEKLDANGQPSLAAIGTKRVKPSAFEVVLVKTDISGLASGNYRLTVEMRNRLNELLSSKTLDFQRANPYLDIEQSKITQEMADKEFVKDLSDDELKYSLRALTPKISGDESGQLRDILQAKEPAAMRLFLFNYFVQASPTEPKVAYDKYMTVAKMIDARFRQGIGFGFESDRGYRWLKYGKPTDILTVDDDPSAPPYEIWVYESFPFTGQTNVKFLFYAPNLTAGDFVLLHSNARGETSNPRWQRQLYKNSQNDWTDGDIIDGTEVKSNVGRHAKDYLRDF